MTNQKKRSASMGVFDCIAMFAFSFVMLFCANMLSEYGETLTYGTWRANLLFIESMFSAIGIVSCLFTGILIGVFILYKFKLLPSSTGPKENSWTE